MSVHLLALSSKVLYCIALYCLQSRPEVVGCCVVGQYGESLLRRYAEGESRVKPSFSTSFFTVLVSLKIS